MKAIIFDFVGVLAKKDDRYIPKELSEKIDRLIGQVTDDKVFKNKLISDYDLTETEFQGVIDDIANKYTLFKPIWEQLPSLKKDYKLCIINNGTSLTLPIFKKNFPIDKYFDFFISSAIEGTKKPDPKIYEIALQRLSLAPSDVLFMDDNLQNVETAKNLGMKTIYWDSLDSGFKKFQDLVL